MQASPYPSLRELSRFNTTEKLTLSMYVVLKQHCKYNIIIRLFYGPQVIIAFFACNSYICRKGWPYGKTPWHIFFLRRPLQGWLSEYDLGKAADLAHRAQTHHPFRHPAGVLLQAGHARPHRRAEERKSGERAYAAPGYHPGHTKQFNRIMLWT